MPTQFAYRVGVVVVFLGILGGLFVLAGTVEPDPANNSYPGTSEIRESPDQYVGDRVTVGGKVIETEPLTIEKGTTSAESLTFVVENSETTVAVGDKIAVYGTLTETDRITAINTVRHERSNRIYMYLVSFLAGLWVLGRICNHWTLDTTEWALVSRSEPRFSFGGE